MIAARTIGFWMNFPGLTRAPLSACDIARVRARFC
jgi:hypothetical protein